MAAIWSYKQVPNELTISRALIGLAVLWLYTTPFYASGLGRTLVAALFTVGALTDWLDGKWARDWVCESTFGKTCDPIADKLLLWPALIILWCTCPGPDYGELHLTLFLLYGIIALYDVVATGLEIALAFGKIPSNDSRPSAKYRVAALQASLGLYLWALVWGDISPATYRGLIPAFAGIIGGFTVYAAYDFLWAKRAPAPVAPL